MDAASIEQMNKVRASLGMPPLPVPGQDVGPQFKEVGSGDESDDMSTLDKRQAAAGSNWQRLEEERRDKIERQKRKDAAKRARDAAQRFAKLEGKGLGEAGDDEMELDTRSWLLQQKKRQKKIEKARKLDEELAEREKQQAEYTSKDLAGVKVAHEANDFDETAGEQVLTLRDAEIGSESDEDELENVELRAKEMLEEKLQLKKKRPDYDPTDQENVKNVLSKYDEEIDGKKQKRFTLDGQGSSVQTAKRAIDTDGGVKSKGVKINLDMLKDEMPASDYIEPSAMKMKKPKKKKDRKTRQKAADDDDIVPTPPVILNGNADAMEVDLAGSNGVTINRKRTYDFNDDDDLQAQLAEQRRQTLKKRKKTDAAELTRQMREEMPIDDDDVEESGLVMDETSEFVANLKKPKASSPLQKTHQTVSARSPALEGEEEEEDEDGDTNMDQSYADADEAFERAARAQLEASRLSAAEGTATGLDEEETITSGIAATLSMLRKRGLVETTDEGLSVREQQRREFLASKQHLIDEWDLKARQQRESDRKSGKWDRMSNRDRDAYARKQNEAREAYIAKLLAEKFNKEYKPDVKLEYHDEFGRSMNQKEAFKHMSHMFHGKGSGKQKTEKRLKKIEDEKKEMSKGMLNVADDGGMAGVQGREGRKQKQAGVRLQ